MTENRLERLLQKPERPRQISFLELFFDLALIFAFVQISRRFLRDFGWENSVETLLLLGAIWWVWMGTVRTADWFNPDAPYLRGLITGLMFAGLLGAAAIPEAFGKHGLVFAGAYVVMHVIRHLGTAYAVRGHPYQTRSIRAMVWFGGAATLWLAGAFLPAGWRLTLWGIALVIDFIGPAFGWPVPGMAPVREDHLRSVGEHIAERYRQVFIIALGELVLSSGISYSQPRFDLVRTVAFAIAFLGAVVMLWGYYLPHGLNLGRTFDQQPSRSVIIAAYSLAIMITGIVITAMSADILITRPLGAARADWSAAIAVGPTLYLLGRTLYAWTVFRSRAWRAPLAMLVIVAMTPGLVRLPPLAVGAVVNFVLLGVVLSYRRIKISAPR